MAEEITDEISLNMKTIYEEDLHKFLAKALDRSPISFFAGTNLYVPSSIIISHVEEEGIQKKVVFGLCPKRCITEFTMQNVKDEASKFAKMFKNLKYDKQILKICLIFATKYSKEILLMFENGYASIQNYVPYPDQENIDEVIIVDLSTELHLSEFFGIENVQLIQELINGQDNFSYQ